MKKVFCLILLVFSQSVLGGLISHWKFDGDLKNTCDANCEPRIFGFVEYSDGILGKCLDISGSGDNAVVFYGTEGVTNGLTAFTISFWYKGKLADNPAWASIVSKNGESGRGWQVRFYGLEGGGCFTVRGGNGSDDCTGYAQIADGKWHHIVGVFDGSFVYLYVDGVLEEIVEKTGVCGATDCSIVVGAKLSEGKEVPYNYSKGMIDELCIYDEAIGGSQIKELGSYNKAAGGYFIEMYNRLGVFPIQLHRGGGANMPENTLETFEWAWSQKVIPEADVRMTSDGAIVCCHDEDIKRICPDEASKVTEKNIGRMTLSQIKEFDVGEFRGKPGEKIPTLEEVFLAMSGKPERFLFLDYKYIDMQRLAEMVKKYGIEKQVIFTNKSHSLIMQYKQLIPQSQTMLWVGGTQRSIAKKFEALRMENYSGITILQVHYKKSDDAYTLSDKFLFDTKKELEQRGIIFQVLPLSINDKMVFEKLMDMGIRSFASDYPDAVIGVYAKKIKSDKQN